MPSLMKVFSVLTIAAVAVAAPTKFPDDRKNTTGEEGEVPTGPRVRPEPPHPSKPGFFSKCPIPGRPNCFSDEPEPTSPPKPVCEFFWDPKLYYYDPQPGKLETEQEQLYVKTEHKGLYIPAPREHKRHTLRDCENIGVEVRDYNGGLTTEKVVKGTPGKCLPVRPANAEGFLPSVAAEFIEPGKQDFDPKGEITNNCRVTSNEDCSPTDFDLHMSMVGTYAVDGGFEKSGVVKYAGDEQLPNPAPLLNFVQCW